MVKNTVFRALRILWISIWVLLSVGIFSACNNQPNPTPPKIVVPTPVVPLRIGLSDSAFTLEQLARRVSDRNPGQPPLHFIVGNDQTLLEDLDAGRLDAAIIYSIPESEERWISQIAFDGLIIFTHPEIELAGTGIQEVRALFAGRVPNWSTFDESDSPVTIFSREPGSGAGSAFDNLVMDGLAVSADSLVTINEIDMLNTVTNTPGAVGYAMMGSNEGVTTIAIEGNQATPISTADKTYLLNVPLFFVSSEKPSGDLQIFLANLISEEGQSIIGEKYGRLR